jgi:lipoprotein-anchoring transpeptidase ErfK/SrfK
MAMFVVEGSLMVDLSDRTLSYRVGGSEVLSSEVGVGSSRNPTPTGRFFVTDSVTMADPDSPWGPHALGLSARSDTITEYNGGDGIIGIHGTNSPWSIGQASSMGCVRVPNDVITTLHQMVVLGTPVEIGA